MFDFLDGPVRDTVVALFGLFGYVGVAVMVALESVVVPIPSEVVLPFAGFLVADPRAVEPLTGAPWHPVLIVAAAEIGSVVGAVVAYLIGARGGRPLLRRWGRFLLLHPGDLERGERFFADHGRKAALLGRLVPVVRSLVSYAAGMTHMPLGPYIVYTAIGSLPWNVALVGAGLLLGASWERIEAMLRPFELLMLVALGLATVAVVVFLVRRRVLRGAAPA